MSGRVEVRRWGYDCYAAFVFADWTPRHGLSCGVWDTAAEAEAEGWRVVREHRPTGPAGHNGTQPDVTVHSGTCDGLNGDRVGLSARHVAGTQQDPAGTPDASPGGELARGCDNDSAATEAAALEATPDLSRGHCA